MTPAVPAASRAALVIALLYLVGHLPFLAPALEDIDSINFALALHDYDPTDNRPHPPGYPVYVAIGRLSLLLIRTVSPGIDSIRADALALAILSALAGMVALIGAWSIFRTLLRETSSAPVWATALLASSPLFWLTGLRPMSDMPGLAAALVSQAMLLKGLDDRRALVAGALATGLAAGARSQTIWLTLPLLAIAIWAQRAAGVRWLLTRPMAALAIGGLAWAIPLVAAAGGIDRYVYALGLQAGSDFASVDMLWGDPTARHLALAVRDAFVLPWSWPPLASAVSIAAIVGAALMGVRDRRALALLLLAFGPYTIFHLLFQETLTVRYALPIVPAVAFLAARGMMAAGSAVPLLAVPAIVAALIVSVPAGAAYGREAHPAFRALRDMTAAAKTNPPGAVFAHHALGRPLEIEAARLLPVVVPPIRFEWLDAVDYWRRGGEGPVWFLADPRRTDLALIDPQSRGEVVQYRWGLADRPELGGTRPMGADWYRIRPPGWFAGEGWSLTLEAGGVTAAGGTGLDRRSIEAYVRRRREPTWIMVGGRDLGAPATPPSIVELSIDGRPLESWRLDPAAGANFLRVIALPDGIPPGPGTYATLAISARAEAAGASTPPVAIRQFDVQSADAVMYGFGEGWHEEESDAGTGFRWRWTSERSVLRIAPPQGVEVLIRGESPMKYFDVPPLVRVLAGGREIAQRRPSSDFEWRIKVPAEDVARTDGAITIETDRVYLPGRVEGTADSRHLGLRLHEVRVYPLSP